MPLQPVLTDQIKRPRSRLLNHRALAPQKPPAEGEGFVGEIRVQVRLTNSREALMAEAGQLPAEQTVHSAILEALVDTGAYMTVIPAQVADNLGLMRRRKETAVYADGRREEVDVTEAVELEIQGRHAVEEALILGDEVLIGQLALERTDLFVDPRGQRLVPNPAHPDRPVWRV